MKTPGAGYANAICDARVDSFETSTQCLSYGYSTRSVAAATGGTGGQVTENTPLLPTLSPLKLFTNLFSGVMPGGGTGNPNDVAKMLKARRSVLDYSMSELARMRTLAPGAEARSKIDVHTEAIRKIEMQLTTQINNGTMTPTSCTVPPTPDATLTGKTGSKNDYRATPTPAAADDSPIHEQIGKAHMGILKAAFVCDLIRVGTFQWSPGTNHVSFKGLFPNAPDAIYMHHPTSHIITSPTETTQSLPAAGLHQDVVNFLAAVQTWYNQKMADILLDWKATTDVYGGNLLANTIIPYVTEVAETTHSWNPAARVHLRRQRAGHEGRSVPERRLADELVLGHHRAGVLQDDHPAQQPAGDGAQCGCQHLRAHRRQPDPGALGRAVARRHPLIRKQLCEGGNRNFSRTSGIHHLGR